MRTFTTRFCTNSYKLYYNFSNTSYRQIKRNNKIDNGDDKYEN